MRFVVNIFLALVLTSSVFAQTPPGEQKEAVSVKEVILEHTADSYFWHFVTWKERPIEIPLPVILWGNSGFALFSSARLSEGESYRGFKIATQGKYAGKIVESRAGEEIRPIDLSITKNVFALMINAAILLILVFSLKRWYTKRGTKCVAPRGVVGAFEMLMVNIEQDLIKPCVGASYREFSPYLLTVFFFILINNFAGLIPIFPFGANTSGNIAFTMVLALFSFVIVNISGTKEYWKEVVWPEVPVWLKIPIPLMPFVEIFGLLSKPFALMIRLLANIFGGHSVILGLITLIFVVNVTTSTAMSSGLSVFMVILTFFMYFVEMLVAFIQAYVFTLLSALFIGLSQVKHKEKESVKSENINNL